MIAVVFAQPPDFFVFSVLTKLGDKINVLSKMTHFGLILPDFRAHFSRSPTTHLILVNKKKQNEVLVCASLGAGDHD